MSLNGSSDTSSINDGDETWITWFCSLAGNQLFCEIDKSFIADSFNLFGLKNFIGKDYNGAIDIILDRTEIESEEISRAAAILYGLIHARYIITSMGLEAMHTKYSLKEFGECPRALCRGQAVVPMGFSDEPRQSSVKLFCPLCQESYQSSPSFRHIDGAYFSTTFPHLFFMTYEDALPTIPLERYAPKVFGFKIHESAKTPKENIFLSNHSNSNSNSERILESPSTINSNSKNKTNQNEENKNNQSKNLSNRVSSVKELEVAQILVTEGEQFGVSNLNDSNVLDSNIIDSNIIDSTIINSKTDSSYNDNKRLLGNSNNDNIDKSNNISKRQKII